MRFNVDQTVFLEGVQTVQRAISTKSVLPPILSGIYIEAKDNEVFLKATDLEIGIEYVLQASVEENGASVLPARYFVELVKKLPSTQLSIEEIENRQIRIHYGKSEVVLNAYDADEFPPLQQFDETEFLSMKKDVLIRGIRNVSIAASSDYSRPIFTGILMEINQGNQLKLVATDTHRLAYTEIMMDKDRSDINTSVIIPSRSLIEISRIFGMDDSELKIYIDRNKILFEADGIKITSRLIEGQFVNYRQVIPEDYSTRVRLLNKGFSDSLEPASLLSMDDLSKRKHNTVKLSMDEGQMRISSKSSQIGELEEEIPIYLDGNSLEIGFNAKYLLDVLRVVETEEVVMDLTTELSPGIIRPVDGKDNALFLILPIRLS